LTVFIKDWSRSFIAFSSGMATDGLADGEIEAEGLKLDEGLTDEDIDEEILGEIDGF
jgi:hypothetical protein